MQRITSDDGQLGENLGQAALATPLEPVGLPIAEEAPKAPERELALATSSKGGSQTITLEMADAGFVPERPSLLVAAAAPVIALDSVQARPERITVEDEGEATRQALQQAVDAGDFDETLRILPTLRDLAEDSRPRVRENFAVCYSILATAGRAPADRTAWGLLLGLSKYDEDDTVRRAADIALADMERHGTIAS